jgi:hypothetical protein
MRYIITEQQNDRIAGYILKFLDDNLTPYGGWKSIEEYEQELDENSGELFIPIKDVDEWDLSRSNHIYYSVCDNPNYVENPFPEGACPVVMIPPSVLDALNGFFGDIWKGIFKEWFEEKTGAEVFVINSY